MKKRTVASIYFIWFFLVVVCFISLQMILAFPFFVFFVLFGINLNKMLFDKMDEVTMGIIKKVMWD